MTPEELKNERGTGQQQVILSGYMWKGTCGLLAGC